MYQHRRIEGFNVCLANAMSDYYMGTSMQERWQYKPNSEGIMLLADEVRKQMKFDLRKIKSFLAPGVIRQL